MGRTEPSVGQPPAAFRKDARAKKARATLNKVIPALLSAHPRAQRGIDASELIVDPPAQEQPPPPASSSSSSRAGGRPSKDKDDASAAAAAAAAAATTPRLVLRVTDALTAAHALLVDPATGAPDRGNLRARVGVLNMASALAPGGGFRNGAGGAEEALCLRTTLLPGLRDGFYRLPEVGAVYTPDVLVFREGGGHGNGDQEAPDLAKRDRWFVDVVSAATLRFPDVAVDPATGRGAYADAADGDLVRRKMRAVLRVARARRRRSLVLGAWGCGPHGHPVAEVAAAWRAVLLGTGTGGAKNKNNKKGGGPAESWAGIETVVFAIKDAGLADAFATAFGEGLVREEEDDDDDDGEDEDDAEAVRMRELQDKIAEMQVRVQQARSPQLQAGLRSILTSLEAQAPPGQSTSQRGGSSGQPGSGDEDEEGDDGAETSDES